MQLPKEILRSGGSASHLKAPREFVRRRPMHLVLRSTYARYGMSFLNNKNEKQINKIIRDCQKRFFVQVMQYVNVGNHLHLKIKANSEDSLANFLRTLTALIARKVTGSKKGNPFLDAEGKKVRFWTGLAFTRVLQNYFEELVLDRYFSGNAIEAKFGKEAREGFFNMTPFPIPRRLSG